MNHVPHNHVAIIGTGFGAIATAVRLQQAGFDDSFPWGVLSRILRILPTSQIAKMGNTPTP
jgi:hypothetical protein